MLGLLAWHVAAAARPRLAEGSELRVIASAPPLEPAPRIAERSRAEPAGTLVERIRSGASVPLLAAPGHDPIGRLGPTTEFGSPQTVPVVARRGNWLGVLTSELPNNQLAWVPADVSKLSPARTTVALRVDLARRRLALMVDQRVVQQAPVGIGTDGSPTPTGRFAVTDKLAGPAYSATNYGCCILALSGHQSDMPAGWQGGNRLAIHGSSDPSTIGAQSSAGCLISDDRDLRALMRKVPLGAPVYIDR